MSDNFPLVLVVHNVRSAANVGSMLRTADGAGVREVWLTGYTPAPALPNRKFLTTAEKSLAKVALGAEHTVVWYKQAAIGMVLSRFRSEGYQLIALEQSDKSIALDAVSYDRPIVLIVGNEVRGIDHRILKQCDRVVEIPMHGQKHSLNVAISCGIALYAIRGTMEKRKTL